MSLERDEIESVRHLVELGYVDPDEVSARASVLRQHGQEAVRQAVELQHKGTIQEAIRLLGQLAADDPEWISPHQLLAEIHYQAGRAIDAQVQIDWLTEHGVANPRLALIMGSLALLRHDLKAALRNLEYACHAEPELASGQTLLGTARLRAGMLQGAEISFQMALEKNGTDANAKEGLAAVCLKRGTYEEAADWALQALAQDMRLTRAHFYLGLALTQLGRPEEALQALETCARTAPTRAAPYRWMALIAKEDLDDVACGEKYREQGREIVRQRRQRL